MAVIAGASAFITLKVEGLESKVAILKNAIQPAQPEKPANKKAGISFNFGKEIFCFIKIKITIIDEKKYLKTPRLVASTSFKTTLVRTKAVAQKKIAIKAHSLAVNFVYIFLDSFFYPLLKNIKFILSQKVEILNKILYNLKR